MNHADFIEQCRAWDEAAQVYARELYQGIRAFKYEQSAVFDYDNALYIIGAPMGNPEPIPLRKGA